MKKIEQLFFKERIVFVLNSDAHGLHTLENDLFFCRIFDCGNSNRSPDSVTMKMLASVIGAERLEARLKNPLLTLYTAHERKSNLPVGFCWSAMTTGEIIWHDKFPIDPGFAFLFNGHVLTAYRRRGVYKLLIAVRLHHLFLDKKASSVITLVERSNTPSIKAQETFGFRRASNNYLIKFFGRNIFSIFVGEFKGWYCVLGKTKSHSF